MSRDPIGNWGDSGNLGNGYAYVGNSPWQYTDPYGLCPTCLVGAAAGLVAGVAIYGVAVATTDADFSWKHLGLAAAIGTAGGALIGTGAGIGAGAGMLASLEGAFIAGVGEGLLTSVTLDALDDGAVNEGVGAHAASAATAGTTNGLLRGLGMGYRALKHADNAGGVRNFVADDAGTSAFLPRIGLAAGGDAGDDFATQLGRQAARYGKGGVEALDNGRYRFTGELTPAKVPGAMAGTRMVREWDSIGGGKFNYFETVDHLGLVRQIRPDVGPIKMHYMYSETGSYTGYWLGGW